MVSERLQGGQKGYWEFNKGYGVKGLGNAIEGFKKATEGVGKSIEGLGKSIESLGKGIEGLRKAIEGLATLGLFRFFHCFVPKAFLTGELLFVPPGQAWRPEIDFEGPRVDLGDIKSHLLNF